VDESYVVVSVSPDAWEAMVDREPELAMLLECGLLALSEWELMALLVLHGVPVERPA
jgi:hypothetical protein